ncbi:MAG: adenylate/guanylate cyclase domain-containing protein [Planctomycetes bacterium]|nr:adenylate/guanylate cyclase domain-containing protein [Planctomycetota bacterium]
MLFAGLERARHAIEVAPAADRVEVLQCEAGRIDITIGAHWGPVVAGVVGKGERREFTVLGDTVNVCARIQQLASSHGLQLVVSEQLLRQAGGGVPEDAWRALAETSLRGRQAPIRLLARDIAPIRPGS